MHSVAKYGALNDLFVECIQFSSSKEGPISNLKVLNWFPADSGFTLRLKSCGLYAPSPDLIPGIQPSNP